jgi:hypothetical protein
VIAAGKIRDFVFIVFQPLKIKYWPEPQQRPIRNTFT